MLEIGLKPRLEGVIILQDFDTFGWLNLFKLVLKYFQSIVYGLQLNCYCASLGGITTQWLGRRQNHKRLIVMIRQEAPDKAIHRLRRDIYPCLCTTYCLFESSWHWHPGKCSLLATWLSKMAIKKWVSFLCFRYSIGVCCMDFRFSASVWKMRIYLASDFVQHENGWICLPASWLTFCCCKNRFRSWLLVCSWPLDCPITLVPFILCVTVRKTFL